jgi:hypothetical protein
MPIDLPQSMAIQPLSIARSSDQKYLARRLFQRIARSKEAFESAGFRYRGTTDGGAAAANEAALPAGP